MTIAKMKTEVCINKKGYQSVKLYIPNDTLMGQHTKENELKEESKLSNVNRRLKTTTKRTSTSMNLTTQ